jgi:Tfp pilus assembly protein PilO
MGLNNLSPRDTVLVIVIVNIVCYFLGFQIIVSPLYNAFKTTNAEREAAVEEYNELKYEAEQEAVYDSNISELKKERRDEINSKFYQTVTAEKFHKWFSNLKNSKNVNLTNFSINRVTTTSTDEDGNEVEADFVDNQVTLDFTSTYAQLVDLLQEIENDGKASALTNLNISPSPEGVMTNLTYSFYSITKNEGEDKDFTSTELNLGTYSPNQSSMIGNVKIAAASR